MVIILVTVIRMDTPHFAVLVALVSQGVAAVARESSLLVTFVVLITDILQQALKRLVIESNQGWHYALQVWRSVA